MKKTLIGLVVFLFIVANAQDNLSYPLGVNLGFIGSNGREFTDVAKTYKGWQKISRAWCPGSSFTCDGANVDENGWPLEDAQAVIMDVRPWGAWWGYDEAKCPFCADTETKMDVSGTYKLSFNGQADVRPAKGNFEIKNKHYDAKTNLTTADLLLPKGEYLIYAIFENTKRTADSKTNTGISNLKLIRPGYHDKQQTFTDEFLASFDPFSTIRTMTWTGAPYDAPDYTDKNNKIDWSERNRPEWRQPQRDGVAWEYIVELANLTGKDIWINIPIFATDDYINGLAEFLKANLDDDIVVYVEYSNEVWNSHFKQYVYNLAAAWAEKASGNSPLNADGEKDADVWRKRRYALMNVKIAKIFSEVFGSDAVNRKIRVVHAWFSAFPQDVAEQLAWIDDSFGPPSDYIYAIAAGAYIYDKDMPGDASVAEVHKRLIAASDAAVANRLSYKTLADKYQLRNFVYEGGPDTVVNLKMNRKTDEMNAMIAANKAAGIEDVLIHDIWNNWFEHKDVKGDLYMFYDLYSSYNRWGMWGIFEDVNNKSTAKWDAMLALQGLLENVPTAVTGLAIETSLDKLSLSWDKSFAASGYIVERKAGSDFIEIARVKRPGFIDDNVEPNKEYSYRIIAVNSIGKTKASEPLSAKTQEAILDEYLKIYFTDTAPVLDAVAEDIWQKAPKYAIEKKIGGKIDDANDLSATVQALFDNDYLYVFYTVTDDRHFIGRASPWHSDSVELYLDGGNEKYVWDSNDLQFIILPVNDAKVFEKNKHSEGVEYFTQETESGYIVEAKIPWKLAAVTNPQNGQLIGFDAHINDDDNGDLRDGKLAWNSPTDKAWTNPQLFGTAVLIKQ